MDKTFREQFSEHAAGLINFMARAAKSLDEQRGLVFCHDCEFYRRTDQPFTQYWCANEKTPIRKGEFEEFQNMACPMGRKKATHDAH